MSVSVDDSLLIRGCPLPKDVGVTRSIPRQKPPYSSSFIPAASIKARLARVSPKGGGTRGLVVTDALEPVGELVGAGGSDHRR